MIVNLTTNRQCIPFCSLHDGHPLPVVNQMCLLGLIIDDKLTWWPLVENVIRRSRSKVWSLVKLREAGAKRGQLLDLYIARVRSTLECGAQVFGAVINMSQAEALEAVQMKSIQIVMGSASKSYVENMAALGLKPLSARRHDLMKCSNRIPLNTWQITQEGPGCKAPHSCVLRDPEPAIRG